MNVEIPLDLFDDLVENTIECLNLAIKEDNGIVNEPSMGN